MRALWKLKTPAHQASALALETGLSTLEAHLLINRGITEKESAHSFLSPKLAYLSDPMLLQDMDRAVERMREAVVKKEGITIYGDFDADGLTATALLLNFFSSLGISASYYIPDRFKEGYGLNAEAVKRIARNGTRLLITVDCGISGRKEISLAKDLGMKAVVTDHHQVREDLLPLCPVINPLRKDSKFPFKDLAGVGLAFYLAIALRTALREEGWFRNRKEPDLRGYLDLVALGTVADMVPLLDQNRILVKAGLERFSQSLWPGIKALQEAAEMKTIPITSYDLAFKMAPRLNAAGRLGNAEAGIAALTTQDEPLARRLAEQLNQMNGRRQLLEKEILQEAEEILSAMGEREGRRTLVVTGKGWHRGVLGIVASRLVEKYYRPVIVLSVENGIAMGSARSIPGFHLYHALTGLGHLLQRFGGHEYAAGLTLEASKVDVFSMELERLAEKDLDEKNLVRTLETDGETCLKELTMESVSRIRSLAPFGTGNPEPFFYIPSLEVLEAKVISQRHLKLLLRQEGIIMDAIGFGLAEDGLSSGRVIHGVFIPEIDTWQGYRKVQLRILDLEEMEDARPKRFL